MGRGRLAGNGQPRARLQRRFGDRRPVGALGTPHAPPPTPHERRRALPFTAAHNPSLARARWRSSISRSIAEPVVRRAGGFERHYKSFCLLDRTLFLTRQLARLAQNLQLWRRGRLSERCKISGAEDGRACVYAQLGGALRILQNARSRARAPWPSEDFRPDPYGCSPVRSSLTVAGLAFDILREPADDQGLYPRVRLKLHKMSCGAPRVAAARTSAVAHWWGAGSAPPRDLSHWPRPCGVWGVGSGQSDAGPACTCHELSRTRLVASAELKKTANFHLSPILGLPTQCGRASQRVHVSSVQRSRIASRPRACGHRPVVQNE